MFRKILPFFLLLFTGYTEGKSQACSTLGQTPGTAFPVCGRATFFQQTVPTCSNNTIPVPCNDGVSYIDFNPFWYSFTCYQAGTLDFLISPANQGDDYDWQLFDITGHSPNDVYTDPSLFVTGNWSGSPGQTGTSHNNRNDISCASDPRDNVPTFSSEPDLIIGHNYLLLVSHYSGSNQSGYSLSFGGGTAGITDLLQPAALLARANCSGESIFISFNKKLQCASVAKDGSDFSVSAPGVKVIAASGINCDNSFEMDSVMITLDKPLPAGSYSVTIKKGGDNNTLLDNCDNPVPENSNLPFSIIPIAPTLMDSLTAFGCSADAVELVFKNGIRCNSIAADGSDFIITGSLPVTVASAAGDSCVNGFAYIIKVKLSQPIQNAGNFTITLTRGTDGNTLLDECGQETPKGSSLNFVTADKVSAAFNYNVNLGCVFDTLFYSHDGKGAINEWNWVFDVDGTSNARDSFFLFKTYGAKHIKLNVSNGVCSDSSSADILLDNELIARLVVLPSTQLCPEDELQFIDSSKGKIVSWYWTFGDGSTSTAQNPPPKSYPFPPTREGSVYPAALIVKNNINCFDTAQTIIKVFYNCYIAVPSAFTPNGDGLNDYLSPLNTYKADNLEFRVYNRWGQLVFETKDPAKRWDGRVSGNPQPSDTYIWMLHYTNRDTGKFYSLKGTTVLIR